MPAAYQDASVTSLLAGVVVTATANSTVFSLPQAECYALYLVATAVSGTTPVINGILQTSIDGGTTWVNTGNAFASVTAAATQELVFKPTMGNGEAAAVVTVVAGTASAKNQPVARKFMRIAWTVTGTTPTATITLVSITNPKGYSVV